MLHNPKDIAGIIIGDQYGYKKEKKRLRCQESDAKGDLLKTTNNMKLLLIAVLTVLFVAAGFYVAGKYASPPVLIEGVEHNAAAIAKTFTTTAEDRLFYKLLDEKAASDSAAEVSAFVFKNVTETPGRLGVALDWARDNSVRVQDLSKLNSLYFMLYADLGYLAAQAFLQEKMVVQFLDMSRTALAALMTFEILLATDTARCEDETARNIIIPLMAPRIKTLQYTYGLFDRAQIQYLTSSILTGTSGMWNRRPNAEICASGRDSVIKALEQGGTTRKQGNETTTITVLVPPKEFKADPKFIPQDRWMEKSTEIYKNIGASWIQRYMDYVALRESRRAAKEKENKQ